MCSWNLQDLLILKTYLSFYEIHNYLSILYFMGFPCGSAGNKSACNVGGLGLIPGLGRSPGEGNSYPLQYSDLMNSVDCISPWGHKELDTTEQLSLSLFTNAKR